MVLVLASRSITDPSLPALLSLPPLQKSCQSFLSQIPAIPSEQKYIHVLQGEAALVDLHKVCLQYPWKNLDPLPSRTMHCMQMDLAQE